MKVVLDTNIIIAGLYSKRGASYQLLKGALSGGLLVAVSPLLALEYEGVLHQKITEGMIEISEEVCGKILGALFAVATVAWRPSQIRPFLPDPSDDKVLECAISCDCTHIITFNQRHFPNAFMLPWGIQAMKPGDFLIQWREEMS
jgi:putative PIN family toxin of toxin-antitoxin system